MSSHTVSGPLRWRARAVTVPFAVGVLGLLAAGRGGTQPPASGVPRASPGGTSAGPARPPPAATMTTRGPAPATAASQTFSAPVTAPAGPVFQAGTWALTAAVRTRMTGVSSHPGCRSRSAHCGCCG